MAVPVNSPIVALLRKEFEELFGQPIKTPCDFFAAAGFASDKAHATISESTMRRLYKPEDAYPNYSDTTLNVVSVALGYKHFKDFCDHVSKSGIQDSELSCGEHYIKADDLDVGDRIYIAWLPDRECSLKYLGNYRFEVDEVVNATIVKGDRFSCRCFTQDKCLLVDDLEHDGKRIASYIMGKSNGLACVKKV